MKTRTKPLLTKGAANTKTAKSEKLADVDAFILHLAPARSSGVLNVCGAASFGCKLACLNTAGRGGIFKKGERSNAIQEARIRRTREYAADPAAFIARLSGEITRAARRAAKRGRELVVRVNGTSDLPKLALALAELHPDVTFYDYTKLSRPWERERSNYSLTFSRSESNDAACFEALAHGVNVAVVFDTPRGAELPKTYFGVPVYDGDTSDLRHMDPRGVVVGLRAKGRARRDTSGFVVKVAELPLADRPTPDAAVAA
jgi:hypothetical protein